MVILSAALSIALVDEMIHRLIGGAPAGGQHWTQSFSCLAATFAVAVIVISLITTTTRLVLRATSRVAIACGVSMVALVAVCCLTVILPGEDIFPSDWSTGAPVAAAVLVAAWIAFRAYPALKSAATRCNQTQWMTFLTLTPLALGVALLFAFNDMVAPSVNLISIVLAIVAAGGLYLGWRTFSGRTGFDQIRSGTTIVTASAALLMCGATAWLEPKPISAAPARPNGDNVHKRYRRVLLLTVDTLRADKLGYLGGDVATPHIDALAKDAVIFENAISPAPWTLPAFASMMTGLYPNVHQATRYTSRLPVAATTLAQRLQAAGLRTAAIGDNPFLLPESGMDQGFDEYHMFGGPDGKASFGKRLLHRVDPRRFTAVPTSEDLTDMACHWLNRNGDSDFFLWLHYFDPHLPYAPPKRFAPDGTPPQGLGREFNDIDGVRGGYIATTADQRAWIEKLYDAEVRYVDDCIGRVLAKLDTLGIADQTLIVFASDHGEEFWEHDGFEHGHSMHHEVIHVPLIIKQASASPARVTTPISTTVITPTILAALGIEVDADDFSVAPLDLESDLPVNTPHNAPVYSSGLLYFDNRESVVAGNIKYITSMVTGKEELYDLETDPGETTSVAPGQPSLLESARQWLTTVHHAGRGLSKRLNIQAADADVSSARLRKLQSLGYVQ